jgi:nicotinamidase-related amidase
MPDSVDLPGLTRQVAAALPVAPMTLKLGGEPTGLVIVDEVNGFATVGSGSLAPPKDNPQVAAMVEETVRLARGFSGQGWPILAFLDTHIPGKPEPPYPPHCEAGTGEEDLVPQLTWLGDDPHATLVRKDCINGFVGAIRPDGSNAVVDWVNANGLARVLVVGICTDICVMDFVLTLLSARNHDLMPSLKDISVHAGACATYDLPKEAVEHLGLPETACHPQDLTHHLGLYFMASRGAEIAGEVVLPG